MAIVCKLLLNVSEGLRDQLVLDLKLLNLLFVLGVVDRLDLLHATMLISGAFNL